MIFKNNLIFTLMKNTRMITRSRKNYYHKNFSTFREHQDNTNWDLMVSASKVRNYLLDDPLLDWLKEFNIVDVNSHPIRKHHIYTNNSCYNSLNKNQVAGFTNFIMKQGLMFESHVYQFFKRKHQVYQVAESYQVRSIEKFNETIQCMKDGMEIIYQGVLHDYTNNIYGCPDLLVRSDRFNDIFQCKYLSDDEASIPSTKLGTPFHYIVVDIKHSTLYLASNGRNLRNCNSIPAYKGQILIYNKALGTMQGYQSPCGYVLGKKWVCYKSRILYQGNDFMNTLGVIDYENYDKSYIEKVNNAIEWIRDMRENGHKWTLFPSPTRRELYPNMKNEKDGKYRKIKNDISKQINEITSVWMCGFKRRNYAHNQNILSWKDRRCTSANLGFRLNKKAKTLDHILKINRQKRDLIRVNSLTNTDEWRYFGDDVMEFYLDYEIINSNMGQCIMSDNNLRYNSNDIIFMIGLGWGTNKFQSKLECKNQWNYECFIIEQNNKESELKMINTFWEFINKKLIEENKSESLFIHWTNAEPLFYNKLLNRHPNSDLPQKNFYDLNRLFLNNNIVVKGALNFSLKKIANAMYENKLITTCWDKNNMCLNGLSAMLHAYKLYKLNNYISGDEPLMKDIMYYNMVDCKVLWEILSFLRNNF